MNHLKCPDNTHKKAQGAKQVLEAWREKDRKRDEERQRKQKKEVKREERVMRM